MPSYVLHGTGIFTDMNGLDFMANVGKYSIGGAYYGTVCVSIERFFKISLSLSQGQFFVIPRLYHFCHVGY